MGRGEERSSGEKKTEGSGKTEDSVFGNRNGINGFLKEGGAIAAVVVVVSATCGEKNGVAGGVGSCGGVSENEVGLGGLLKGLVIKDDNLLVTFLSTMWTSWEVNYGVIIG